MSDFNNENFTNRFDTAENAEIVSKTYSNEEKVNENETKQFENQAENNKTFQTSEKIEKFEKCENDFFNSESASIYNSKTRTKAIPKNCQNKANKYNGKTVFIIIVALLAFFSIISVFNKNASSTKSFDVKINNEKIKNPLDILNGKKTTPVFSAGNYNYEYIARLDIIGTIQEANETYNQEWLIETVRELKNDKNNKGLLLFIDSPGGAVYQADELYLELLDYKKEGKTIWAYMASTAASGGYYISCAADKIFANRNTMTGSIGVLMGPILDLTELMEKYGIKATTFKSGKNKNMLNYNQPITDEQREIIQSYIDECYEQFVGIVAESRKMTLEKAKEIADGRIYSAKQALQNGLIDGVTPYNDAVKQMQDFLYSQNLCSDEEISVEIMTYKEEDPFASLFKFFGFNIPKQQSNLEELKLLEQFNKIPQGPAYYMGF